jgi:hypothetical protein
MIDTGPQADLFQISASTMQSQAGMPDGFGGTIQKVVRVGGTVGPVVRQGTMMGIDYAIHDLPLGEAITVTVDAKPGAFLILNSSSPFHFFQVSGPLPVMLNPAHLTEKPVDFEARPLLGLR